MSPSTGPQSSTVIAKSTTITRKYSGPLPPPEILAEYEELLPGASQRVFEHMEREQAHRHLMDNRDQDSRDETEGNLYTTARRGQTMAFIVTLVMVGAACGLAAYGFTAAAVAIGGLGLGQIVLGFLNQKKKSIEPVAP